jgi:kynurenine 3-monooxygenase
MSLSHYQLLQSSRPWHMARILYQSTMHRRFRRWYPMDLGTALSVTDIPFAVIRQMQERQNRWYHLGRM